MTTLGFDPDDYDYGPASGAIRRILRDWAAIDWFAPTSASDDEVVALFAHHSALAHRNAPEVFPAAVGTRVERGGWPAFTAWCKTVREQRGWDWKFGGLKKLCSQHSKAHGWTLESAASLVQPRVERPGDLFVRIDDGTGKPTMFWRSAPLHWSKIDDLEPAARDSARFWIEYAQMDVMCAFQWELAEPVEPNDNPFVPLLACTRAGAYPFGLAPHDVVLFRFAAG